MKRTIALVACLFFLASATVWADTLISTTGQWNAPHIANNGGGAFWDNSSSDGKKCNVGFVLENAYGPCQNVNNVSPNLPGTALSYLSAAGNAGAGVNFHFTPGAGDKATFRASIAGFSGDNGAFHDVFGWTLTSCTNTTTCLNPLFNSTNDALNQTALFTPGAAFRYYIAVYNKNNVLQWINFSDTGGSFFALFSQKPQNPTGPPSILQDYWVGAEDTAPGAKGDFDYQDMLVEISPIPEPASLLLFGTGLVGMAGALRRRITGK